LNIFDKYKGVEKKDIQTYFSQKHAFQDEKWEEFFF